ncbi:ribosome hibernation-promoting factor, HPF/YfiA family [Roseimaritima sediminicola]|uniref:ribosome hibernation-promoting factor, HPF/YfiA family n=1 Tax=Roseimaritima sediminicola TaxID=2662066 RepID=UPI00129836DB|nr:ribosome-associated translation inhibitor RaiA [Roseimaritima sediminicola]
MQLSVSARHGDLQAGDQALIEQKVEKLRRFFDRINAIIVTVDMQNLDKPEVEVKVSAEHVDDCVASAQASTVIGALDLVLPKIEQQIRRIKEKRTGHRATGLKHLDPTPTADEE